MSHVNKAIRPSDGVKKGGYTPSGNVPRPTGAPNKPADSAPAAKPQKS